MSNERLLAAGTNPNEWLTYSGSYNGWRHTALAEITPENVAHLSMRWVQQFDIDSQNIEATPLVIDGTIFTVADPGHVLALDAKTGAKIWEYERPIPSDLPIEFPVNRGLAVQGSTRLFRQSGWVFGRHQCKQRKGHLGNVWLQNPPMVIRLPEPPSS